MLGERRGLTGQPRRELGGIALWDGAVFGRVGGSTA